jgi:hypothetical protein
MALKQHLDSGPPLMPALLEYPVLTQDAAQKRASAPKLVAALLRVAVAVV